MFNRKKFNDKAFNTPYIILKYGETSLTLQCVLRALFNRQCSGVVTFHMNVLQMPEAIRYLISNMFTTFNITQDVMLTHYIINKATLGLNINVDVLEHVDGNPQVIVSIAPILYSRANVNTFNSAYIGNTAKVSMLGMQKIKQCTDISLYNSVYTLGMRQRHNITDITTPMACYLSGNIRFSDGYIFNLVIGSLPQGRLKAFERSISSVKFALHIHALKHIFPEIVNRIKLFERTEGKLITRPRNSIHVTSVLQGTLNGKLIEVLRLKPSIYVLQDEFIQGWKDVITEIPFWKDVITEIPFWKDVEFDDIKWRWSK